LTSTCGDKDLLSLKTKEQIIVSIDKNYDHSRTFTNCDNFTCTKQTIDAEGTVTSAQCSNAEELTYINRAISTENDINEGGYVQDPDGNVVDNEAWQSSLTNLQPGDWNGDLGQYVYPVEDIPEYFTLINPTSDTPNSAISAVTDIVEMYTSGSFNAANISCGSKTNVSNLQATTSDTYNSLACYSLTVPAKNCNVSIMSPGSDNTAIASRTIEIGEISGTPASGNTPVTITVSALKRIDEQEDVIIYPDVFKFIPVGTGDDAYYSVTLILKNVVVSQIKSAVGSGDMQYQHPDLKEDHVMNVRIMDGSTAAKPTFYGNMIFGEDKDGTLTGHGHSYLPALHLRYWTTNGGGWNHFYRTDTNAEKNAGDFFCVLYNFSDTTCGIDWWLPNNGSGTIFGNYTKAYSFSGLHNAFFPFGVFENDWTRFDGAPGVAFMFGGFTLPVNTALSNNKGSENELYQRTNGELNSNLIDTPKEAIDRVMADSCAKLKTDYPNARVYVIKYGTSDSSLDNCGPNVTSYSVSANNESALNNTLNAIAEDIKSSCGYTGAYVD
jgi:hypothetical protein